MRLIDWRALLYWRNKQAQGDERIAASMLGGRFRGVDMAYVLFDQVPFLIHSQDDTLWTYRGFNAKLRVHTYMTFDLPQTNVWHITEEALKDMQNGSIPMQPPWLKADRDPNMHLPEGF